MTQTRSKAEDRAAARQRRAERAGRTRLNRAQLRAMEIRAAETAARARAPEEPDGEAAATVELGRRRRATTASRRAMARPIVLTREQEYQFIFQDLKRLGVTAAVLFALMIILLIAIH